VNRHEVVSHRDLKGGVLVLAVTTRRLALEEAVDNDREPPEAGNRSSAYRGLRADHEPKAGVGKDPGGFEGPLEALEGGVGSVAGRDEVGPQVLNGDEPRGRAGTRCEPMVAAESDRQVDEGVHLDAPCWIMQASSSAASRSAGRLRTSSGPGTSSAVDGFERAPEDLRGGCAGTIAVHVELWLVELEWAAHRSVRGCDQPRAP
jgi:hypothetical protein